MLFSELVTNADKAAAFVNGIIPSSLANEVEKMMKENPDALPDNLKPYAIPGAVRPIQ